MQMYTSHHNRFRFWVLLLMTVVLSACGHGGHDAGSAELRDAGTALPASGTLIAAVKAGQSFAIRIIMDPGKEGLEKIFPLITEFTIDDTTQTITVDLALKSVPVGLHNFELQYVIEQQPDDLVLATATAQAYIQAGNDNTLDFVNESAANRGLTYPDMDKDQRNNLEEFNNGWNPREPNPGQPANVTAVAAADGVTLTWDAVAGADSYVVYVATDSEIKATNFKEKYADTANGARYDNLSAPTFTYSDGQPDTLYFFVVTAGNANGEGLESVPVQASYGAHAIGGTIQGLGTGTSVVLRNNGGDDLTVVAGATAFTFGQKIVNGNAYDVTVYTQPVGGACEVVNGQGTVSFQDVSDISVVCRKWGVAGLIETDNAGSAFAPVVAMDSNGNGMAVWRQYDGTRYNIWANYFSAGNDWGTATLIETNNAGSVDNPGIALDGYGNGIAVWAQSDGTTYNIWANHYTLGSGWDGATLIETDNAGNAYGANIALNTGGDGLAVWYQSDGTQNHIWANLYSAGSWASATMIDSGGGAAYYPEIALNDNGNGVAVWQQTDGTRYNIWANLYSAGTWGTATLIETDNAGDAYLPKVVMDDKGNATVVWRQSDGTLSNAWANRYTAGTGWATATLIETDNAGSTGNPTVALDGNGDVMAVWDQSDGTRSNIWANRYSEGSWSTATLIETDDAGPAYSPQIALDAKGNGLAVWQQSDGTRNNIRANRYTAGGGWGSAALIETDNAGSAYYPDVAANGSGNGLAVWFQSDGTRNNVWANRFE